MTVQEVLLPLFLEVILTFVLLFWLAPLRGRDFSSGVARPENVALREPNWSQRSLQVSYSYSNQFELPILFYVLTILAWVTRHADLIFVVLAWIFVIFRYLQRIEQRKKQGDAGCMAPAGVSAYDRARPFLGREKFRPGRESNSKSSGRFRPR
jgi:hypothetical protein